MLKMMCDKCGKDSNLIAYDLLIRLLHNPSPVSITDKSDPTITHDNSSMRIMLCQNCYRKLGLPNIYTALNDNKLEFRDKPERQVKPGDTVWHFCEQLGRLLPYFVESLYIGYLDNKHNCYTYEADSTENCELLDSIDFNDDDIGKTVFLTERDYFETKGVRKNEV